MRILKEGKTEQRKFVCPDCGCVFLASKTEMNADIDLYVCPQDGCHYYAIGWEDGEPYEEPTQDTDADAKKIVAIAQQWLRDDRTASLWMLADKLIANGVIFRER